MPAPVHRPTPLGGDLRGPRQSDTIEPSKPEISSKETQKPVESPIGTLDSKAMAKSEAGLLQSPQEQRTWCTAYSY